MRARRCRSSTGKAPAAVRLLPAGNPIASNLYADSETGSLPKDAVAASLGCGNPTALAELKAGETVLDLGSGGGIDVLLSARRVGSTGKAYGLDMTDEMLALARENQRKAGAQNVEFLKGEIENIPLPDNSVDVIISNCVINLSGDKDRVLVEAFRVLRPGGRFAVSDIVLRGESADIRRSLELWIGCVAGALEEAEYRAKSSSADSIRSRSEPTRIYAATREGILRPTRISTSTKSRRCRRQIHERLRAGAQTDIVELLHRNIGKYRDNLQYSCSCSMPRRENLVGNPASRRSDQPHAEQSRI